MRHTDTLIIGAGQAGLAMSRILADRGVEHAVIERGRIAERWQGQRWDSLRLLTPNWQSRLPGWQYHGPDPDGFMTAREFARHLVTYARSFSAPVHQETSVLSVERREPGGYHVRTSEGAWDAAAVVIATGDCDAPYVPPMAKNVSSSIHQVVPPRYRRPSDLPEGGVLVVGASATGIQLAEEIHLSGRPVTLSVGRHARFPRRYRGKDIMWWLDRMGIFDERADDVHDIDASRRQPSFQLVGRSDHRSLDLGVLEGLGVRLIGSTRAVSGSRVRFAQDLCESVRAADDKLARLLGRIDAFVERQRLVALPTERAPALRPQPGRSELDLRREGIRSIVWATGYRRTYPWLRVPVLDSLGELRHDGGVLPVGGLFALGLRFMRHRNSNFIDGVGRDAEAIAEHLEAYLSAPSSAAA